MVITVENKWEVEVNARHVYLLALEKKREDQIPFIKQQCGIDTRLFNTCMQLYNNDKSDDSFFGLWKPFNDCEQVDINLSGQSMGNYQLLKKIGSGGMADVYNAKRLDGAHDIPVAVKVVKGWGRLDILIERFRKEVKILASLNHPNIAKFIDAGLSKENWPYFVMEYIPGKKLDQYCIDCALPLEKRLELFSDVCAAVIKAHQSLIIHRDIKPSNILVSDDGEVKLLDFGIAKLLDEDNSETLTKFSPPMTPKYSSPEQIKGDLISTESDQYSLGVVLYELLTGISPHRTNKENLHWAVCNAIPISASKAVKFNDALTEKQKSRLAKSLSGDLDAILRKALEKEPDNRYRSIQDFRNDILCVLGNKPVNARKNTVFYIGKRYVRRNASILMPIVIAFISIFFVGLAQQSRVLNERNLAIQEKVTNEKLLNYLTEVFDAANPESTNGNEISAIDLLDRGVETFTTELADRPLEKSKILNRLGVIYGKLGQHKKAISLIQQALETQKSLAVSNDYHIAQTLNNLGEFLAENGQYETAQAAHTEALAIFQQKNHNNIDIANTYKHLGRIYGRLEKSEEAINEYHKALAILTSLPDKNNPQIASIYNNLGNIYKRVGEQDIAFKYYEQALGIQRKTFGNKHYKVAKILNNLGLAYLSAGNNAEAIQYLNESLRVNIEVYGSRHLEVGCSLLNLGKAHYQEKKFDTALGYYDASYEIFQKHLDPWSPYFAALYDNYGTIYRELGDSEKALKYFEKTLAIDIKTTGNLHSNVAITYMNIARAYIDAGKPLEAVDALLISENIFLEISGEKHSFIGSVNNLLARAYLAAQENQHAYVRAQKALQTNELKPDNEALAESHLLLGEYFLIENNIGEAIAHFQLSEEYLLLSLDTLDESHPIATELKQKLQSVRQHLAIR